MIYAGKEKLEFNTDKEISGEYVSIENESFYKISNYDTMPNFFMTIVSDSDHWMFISSNGALAAGRENPENALFPYYTDDKIHDSKNLTGSKTLILVSSEGKKLLWEPFSDRFIGAYFIQRNLYKNVSGNKLIFEEINKDLQLTFRYTWTNSDRFGIVRIGDLINEGALKEIRILDGIQNILPYGIDTKMQNERSTLLDAYKKNELIEGSSLGLYMLSSIPVDKAEPSEALKTTTVWSYGLADCTYLLSSLQLEDFRNGKSIQQESDIRGERGSYFMHTRLTLNGGDQRRWYIAAELNQGPSQVAELISKLEGKEINLELVKDIHRGTDNLVKLVGKADGLQCTKKLAAANRHFSNVLFNIMRGGVFIENYTVRKDDFKNFIKSRSRRLFKTYNKFLNGLEDKSDYRQILASAFQQNDPDLIRNVYEYLPITFSRRHGDPSRPWNMFSIEVKNKDGSTNFNYQGNWRDIFQNWEALAMSFPGFVESMIFRFVNASTADGYNPYRIHRDGIDWEVVDPDDPWSYIGYWGDHQIIYLLKLMEISYKNNPEKLKGFLDQPLFAFANVPYRIKNYKDTVNNPSDTIIFDSALDLQLRSRSVEFGMDGQLNWNSEDEVVHVTLTEKLLITLLAKLSNFIPEAGIWLNTQRPEWNDANNALVGNGVSMVTLHYIRRFLTFCLELYKDETDGFSIFTETKKWFADTLSVFEEKKDLLSAPFSDEERKKFIDGVGSAGSEYRDQLYANGFSGETTTIDSTQLLSFFKLVLSYVDHSILSNKRSDLLYHSYNLIHFTAGDKVVIDRLYEMLEGQVSVLSSGLLSPQEAVELLTALRQSEMYWDDQKSYLLYPDRQLPRFVVKNNIPSQEVAGSDLLTKLIKDGNTDLIEQDVKGDYHFNGSFNNADSVKSALSKLRSKGYKELIDLDSDKILEIFERVFNHASFTGRSGTFFGYEGLGCIYWHMVSKLLLAVQENCIKAIETEADPDITKSLIDRYNEIRGGIGFNKTPEEYGAFPTDAYSHTPGSGGAKQPGMTGQVKEDILSRFGELGIKIRNGEVNFMPDLLMKDEFLLEDSMFEYYDVEDQKRTINLRNGQLAFTFNQVAIIYSLSDKPGIKVLKKDETIELNSCRLSKELSSSLLDRSGEIERIEVLVTD